MTRRRFWIYECGHCNAFFVGKVPHCSLCGTEAGEHTCDDCPGFVDGNWSAEEDPSAKPRRKATR